MFTLTGTLESHAGVPHAGVAVSVEPHPAVNPDPTADVTYAMGWEGKTDDLGHFTVQLETFPGLTYLLRSAVTSPQRFVAPADGVTLDITDIIPIYAPEPMVPYLQALNAIGQPEGHVPTAQGDDTWEWAEQAGGGVQDTGVRDISGLVSVAGLSNVSITVQRVGSVVSAKFAVTLSSGASINYPLIFEMPEGFGGDALAVSNSRDWWEQGPVGVEISPYRSVYLSTPGSITGAAPFGTRILATATYLTPDPWPEILPGVALP